MTTLDDIRIMVAAGESESVEFKATIAELDRAACTIVNQSGGLIVVLGVRSL